MLNLLLRLRQRLQHSVFHKNNVSLDKEKSTLTHMAVVQTTVQHYTYKQDISFDFYSCYLK